MPAGSGCLLGFLLVARRDEDVGSAGGCSANALRRVRFVLRRLPLAYVCFNFVCLTSGEFLANFERPVLGCIEADFASKHTFESSRRDPQDLRTFAPLESN